MDTAVILVEDAIDLFDSIEVVTINQGFSITFLIHGS